MSTYSRKTEDGITVGGLAGGAFAGARTEDGRKVRADFRRVFGRVADGAFEIWAECFGGLAEAAERLPLGADGLPETGGGSEREFLREAFAALPEEARAAADSTRVFPLGCAVVASGDAGMRVFDPKKATTAWAAEHCLRNADALWGRARARETLIVDLHERRFEDASRNHFSLAPRLVVRVLCDEALGAAGFDLGRALRKTFPKAASFRFDSRKEGAAPNPLDRVGRGKTSRVFVDVSPDDALSKRLRGECASACDDAFVLAGNEPGDEVLGRVMTAVARSRAFREFASLLPAREREIVVWRAGVRDGYRRSLAEVGKIFNIPPERVREIELSAFRKLIA